MESDLARSAAAPAEFGQGRLLGSAAMVVIFLLEWGFGLVGVNGLQVNQFATLPLAPSAEPFSGAANVLRHGLLGSGLIGGFVVRLLLMSLLIIQLVWRSRGDTPRVGGRPVVYNRQ